MFDRFTPAARRVVVLAQEEARSLRHGCIGTEHVLLAVLHVSEGDGAQILADAGITLEGARKTIGAGKDAPQGHIPFSSRARYALDSALEAALEMEFSAVTADHILLAVLRDGTAAVAHQVLAASGTSRDEIASLLEEKLKAQDPASDAGTPVGEAMAVFQSVIGGDLGIPHARLKSAMAEALRAAKLAEVGLTRAA